jgi:hypothetical protein
MGETDVENGVGVETAASHSKNAPGALDDARESIELQILFC